MAASHQLRLGAFMRPVSIHTAWWRYPGAFPDANFNQLVLKAFFIGVAVARIAGLEQRKTAELRRMAEDYASERRAAARSVPPDLDLVLS